MKWLALLGLLSAASARAGGRLALLVGNDTGLPGDSALHYPSADVDRMSAVLRELGGFEGGEIRVLKNRPAAEILATLDDLAHEGGEHPLFLFYYSGHGDGGALRVDGTLLPFEALITKVKAVPAQLRVSVLDACQSGAANLEKGVSQGPEFAVKLDDRASEGEVLISSSSADEPSFESSEYGGALFTLHWTTGLRGAADANGDGRITLSEAYAYAYSHTLADTLLSRAGPQHPTFHWSFSGQRDPVLTQLSSSSKLTLHSEDVGDYVLFDGAEREVVAELVVQPGDSTVFALAPGPYVVRKRGSHSLKEARIVLASGEDRLLDDDQMPTVPLVRLARKGPIGDTWVEASVGQYASALGPTGELAITAGAEWERSRWLWGLQALASEGTESHDGLQTADWLVAALASDLYTVRFLPGALRLGPVAGVAFLSQSPTGRSTASSLGGLAGGRLRLEIGIARNLGLFAQADLLALLAPVSNEPSTLGVKLGGVGLFAFASYGAGVRFSW